LNALQAPPTLETTSAVERRFAGVAKLYGEAGYRRLQVAHVVVVGIGGVGSWAAEALARTAVGRLTLIDLDMVAESNTNRQIQALGEHFGAAKVDVMQARIRSINPACRVTTIEDFVSPENVGELLAGPFDYVIDAIDNTRAKVAMIAHCRHHNLPIVTAGAAGGRIDPTAARVDDLARTTQDSLLSRVRQQLRKFHDFPRDPKKRFGVRAVFSHEPMRRPEEMSCAPGAGLSCAGYGSAVGVTASFGFAAAGVVINELTAPPPVTGKK
jgi:tRNA threonylcarbamoyladenosine dehydratase